MRRPLHQEAAQRRIRKLDHVSRTLQIANVSRDSTTSGSKKNPSVLILEYNQRRTQVKRAVSPFLLITDYYGFSTFGLFMSLLKLEILLSPNTCLVAT